MSITPRRLTTNDDASMWLAPNTDGHGAIPVLRFTTPSGQHYEIRLTDRDVERIKGTSAAISSADAGTISSWLDDAARGIRQSWPSGYEVGAGAIFFMYST